MSIDWLSNLPIGDLAAPDAGLALWVYGPMLCEALELVERWGFEYKSDFCTWVKTTANGTPAFGMGYLTRKCTEQVLYATRGRGLKRVNCGVSLAILAPRREHSRKPDELFDGLERLFGPVRRLELFARRSRPSWQV
jgi:N6-adenosine-specific RNA methylase IME4